MKNNKFRDTDIAMFEAFFVIVKEDLLKLYLTHSTTLKTSPHAYLHGHNSILVLTSQEHMTYSNISHIFFRLLLKRKSNEQYLRLSKLFKCTYKCSGFSRLHHYFVYTMNGALGVSHVIHAPTYLSG